jgi:uncharacterized protein YjcR
VGYRKNTQVNNVFNYKGKKQSLRAWSDELGISLGTLQSRVYHYGWTISQALNTQPKSRDKRRQLTAFNKTQSIDEWSKETGIKAATIRSRLSTYKWTMKDAVSKKPHAKRKERAQHLTLDEERGTIIYWSEKTGINQATIRSRLQRFWSPKKTLTTPPDERFRHKAKKK